MDIGTKGWVLLAIGVAAGACIALVFGAVRDVVLDLVDQVAGWWWDLVDAVRRFLLVVGALVLVGLAGVAVVMVLLPRLAAE